MLHCQSSANLSKDPNKDPSMVEFVFYQDSGDFKKLTQPKDEKDYQIECHAKPRHQFVEDLRSKGKARDERVLVVIDDQLLGNKEMIQMGNVKMLQKK